MSASKSTKKRDHLRKVFSVTFTRAALNDSMQYRFNSIKAQSRWLGFELFGRTLANRSQATTHTAGDVPKNALNFRWPTLKLPSTSCLVILCPIRSYNVQTDQRKYEKFQKLLKFRTFVVWFRCVFKFFFIVRMQNLAKIYVQIKVSHK